MKVYVVMDNNNADSELYYETLAGVFSSLDKAEVERDKLYENHKAEYVKLYENEKVADKFIISMKSVCPIRILKVDLDTSVDLWTNDSKIIL